MRTSNLLFKTAVICLALASTALLHSCNDDDDEDDPPAPNPSAITIQGDDNVVLAPGETTDVEMTFDGGGAAAAIIVNRNGGFLEEIAISASASSFTYTTPAVENDASEGDEISYSFALENTAGTVSGATQFTISVAVYPTIDLGGTEVYNVTLPSDGIVPDGTEVLFSEGRSYFIENSVFFGSGSSLTIEAGVTVYLNSSADAAVEVEAQLGSAVNINGTSTAPVVMTSDAVLTTGDPQPGDWDRFRLDETQNAVVRYLRCEYADNGFRISGCDDSNTVEYFQAFRCDAEGLYITDGNIHLSRILNTKSGDNGFRVGDDYNGTMQFIICQGEDHDETEFRLRETASLEAANLTILGPGQNASQGGDLFEGSAIENTFKIYNSILAESVDEDLKLEPIMVTDLNGDYVFAYSYVFNNADPIKDEAMDFFGTFDMNGDPLTNPFFNNALTGGESPDDFTFETIPGIGVDQFVPSTTVTAKENFNPSSVNPVFESVTFVGAVENAANDWTIGWAKNPDGTIR